MPDYLIPVWGENDELGVWHCAVCGKLGEEDCDGSPESPHMTGIISKCFDPDDVQHTVETILFPRGICAICGHLLGDHEQYPDLAIWTCDDDGCHDNDQCSMRSKHA